MTFTYPLAIKTTVIDHPHGMRVSISALLVAVCAVGILFSSSARASEDLPCAEGPEVGQAKRSQRGGGPGGPGMGKSGKNFKVLDTDGDRFLSFEEFSKSERLSRMDEEKRRKLFDFLDRNKDGKLDLKELRPQQPPWLSSLRKEFNHLDTNRTGSLDFAEFSKASLISKLPERQRKKIFKRLDHNRDQQIQRSDLKGFSGSNDRRACPRIDFKKYDTSKSGGLDMDEFFKMPWVSRLPEERRKMLFQKLDKNKDGEISPDEVTAHWADRRKHGPPPHAGPYHRKPSRNKDPESKGTGPLPPRL